MNSGLRKASLRVRGTRNWTRDDDEWHQQATQRQIDALPLLRRDAERWSAGLGTLLGALGLTALISGPHGFNTLRAPYAFLEKLLFFTGAVVGLTAMVFALIASVSSSKKLFLVTGPEIRSATRATVKSALRQLTFCRWLSILAIMLLLAAAGVSFFGPESRPSNTRVHAIPVRAQSQAASSDPVVP